MTLTRTLATALLAATTLLATATGALAQPYPNKPLKLVIPVPPGGTGDLVGRLMANSVASELGQQLVVENRAGASGNIGTAYGLKLPPDGYSLVQCSIGTCAINPSLYSKPGYDLFKDMAPVILLGSSINVLVVNNETGIRSVKELLEQAKAKPLAYGSSGVGASNHLGAELLKKMTHANLLHVPYKGSGPAITDLLGGQIQVFFDNEPSILPFIKSGKVRALAVTGKARSANLPDVPTMEELGYAGFVIEPWFAFGVPSGTPPAMINTLNAAFNRALAQPAVRQTMVGLGITPAGGPPEVLGKLMRSEFERWAELIKAQGIQEIERMKITAIETTRVLEFPNLIWVEVHTDDGLVGLGETFRGAESVEAQIHSMSAPLLLGQDPRRIERHSRALLRGYLGFNGSGVETRAASAIDIALWDLFGQMCGQPVYQLLGGLCHEQMRSYNTCAGYDYNNRKVQRRTISKTGDTSSARGPYDDQVAFVERADELALSLLEEGFTAMKIWPFDPFAAQSDGHFISAQQVRQGLEPFEKIRRAVGDRMQVMCEFHSMWDSNSALTIARELRDYRPYWAEDPIKMDNVQALADYRRHAGIPVCGSETLATRGAFRDLLAADALDIVMLDLSWCGGLSEAKKIATLAEAYQKPIAPHDCTGPVVLMAGLHLALSSPNAIFQEVVRAFLSTFYRDLVTELPVLRSGWLQPPTAPGLGTRLAPGLKQRDDAVVRRSAL